MAPGNASTATVVRDLVLAASGGGSVIDNFQTQTATATARSSSCGAVTATVTGLAEGLANDLNTAFTWVTTDPHNGATRMGVGDTQRTALFEWAAPTSIEWTLVANQRDFSDDDYLQLRAAQGTRHPNTVAQTATSLTLTITLVDESGVESSIPISVYGGGIQRPYLRTGYGTGTGWQDEFEPVRIRLSDFVAGGGTLDLQHIAKIRANFGASDGAGVGRLELDDLKTLKEGVS